MKRYLAFLAISTIISSCSNPEKTPYQAVSDAEQVLEPARVASVDSLANTLKLFGFQLNIPSHWVSEVPTNEMRILQFGVGDDPQLKVFGFHFGKRDNLVEANIDRWRQEFIAITEEKRIALKDSEMTLVYIKGVYKRKASSMSEVYEEEKDFVTLAAIVPSEIGPYFFKMVGPAKIIDNEINSFKEFLNSKK